MSKGKYRATVVYQSKRLFASGTKETSRIWDNSDHFDRWLRVWTHNNKIIGVHPDEEFNSKQS